MNCALLLLATLAGADCGAGPVVEAITEQRTAFNEAIAAGDLPAVEAVLAEDVVLVAGTHSDLFTGREAQLGIWQQDFDSGAQRLVYVRTTQCITPSDLLPMAMETGTWRGENQAGDFASGTYSAKWRLIDDAWRLEAEVFMTEDCGGSACPE